MKVSIVLALALAQAFALPSEIGIPILPINIESDNGAEISNLPSGQDQVEISNLPSEIDTGSVVDPSNLPSEIESGDIQDPSHLPADIDTGDTQDPSHLPADIDTGDIQDPSHLPAEIETGDIQDPSNLPAEIDTGDLQDPAQLPAEVESGPAPECVKYVRTLLKEILHNLPGTETLAPIDRPVAPVDTDDSATDGSNACQVCFQKIQLLIEKSNSRQSAAITF
ncbi:uncharacterized protein [Euwallacea fornicatus]|uniref:uncharacterized protein n=1 Tax=Euwallacea fornicatus TaxID=995702 RepID=UPI00338F0ED3